MVAEAQHVYHSRPRSGYGLWAYGLSRHKLSGLKDISY